MKGQFNAKIAARFTPPKTWVLIEDLSFETDLLGRDEIALLRETSANAVCHGIKDLGIVTCTSGMKTDLASAPRIVWSVISPWDVARAAVIHDHRYASLRKYYHSDVFNKSVLRKARKLSDNVFLWGMQSANPSVSSFKIWSAYLAVRLFGRWPASSVPEEPTSEMWTTWKNK